MNAKGRQMLSTEGTDLLFRYPERLPCSGHNQSKHYLSLPEISINYPKSANNFSRLLLFSLVDDH